MKNAIFRCHFNKYVLDIVVDDAIDDRCALTYTYGKLSIRADSPYWEILYCESVHNFSSISKIALENKIA